MKKRIFMVVIYVWVVMFAGAFGRKLGYEQADSVHKQRIKTLEATYQELGEHQFIKYSDGASAMLFEDWVYFETAEGDIYPISYVSRFNSPLQNWSTK